MNNELELILNYLDEKRGFDFSGYRASMIERSSVLAKSDTTSTALLEEIKRPVVSLSLR